MRYGQLRYGDVFMCASKPFWPGPYIKLHDGARLLSSCYTPKVELNGLVEVCDVNRYRPTKVDDWHMNRLRAVPDVPQ